MSACLRLLYFITIENKLFINICPKFLNIHPAEFNGNFMRFKSGCKVTLVKYFLVFKFLYLKTPGYFKKIIINCSIH